jgi:hypothetical protein
MWMRIGRDRIDLVLIEGVCVPPKKKKKIHIKLQALPIRAQRGQYCHCHAHFGTIRTAATSSIHLYHCHPATATPRAAATHPSAPPSEVSVALSSGKRSTAIESDLISSGRYLSRKKINKKNISHKKKYIYIYEFHR